MTVHFVGTGPGCGRPHHAGAPWRCSMPPTYVSTPAPTSTRPCSTTAPTTPSSSTRQDLDLDQITARLVDAACRRARGRTPSAPATRQSTLHSHEQAKRLDAHGVPWDVTRGVPGPGYSPAAAALLGAELTVPEVGSVRRPHSYAGTLDRDAVR